MCCGGVNFTDWKTNFYLNRTDSVPDSCCRNMTKDCGKEIFSHPDRENTIYHQVSILFLCIICLCYKSQHFYNIINNDPKSLLSSRSKLIVIFEVSEFVFMYVSSKFTARFKDSKLRIKFKGSEFTVCAESS